MTKWIPLVGSITEGEHEHAVGVELHEAALMIGSARLANQDDLGRRIEGRSAVRRFHTRDDDIGELAPGWSYRVVQEDTRVCRIVGMEDQLNETAVWRNGDSAGEVQDLAPGVDPRRVVESSDQPVAGREVPLTRVVGRHGERHDLARRPGAEDLIVDALKRHRSARVWTIPGNAGRIAGSSIEAERGWLLSARRSDNCKE